MRRTYKVPLALLGFLAFVALICTLTKNLGYFFYFYLMIAMPLGALFTIGSLIAFIVSKEDRDITSGFLLTGALLLLTGFFLWTSISFGR
jgi:hypothetical protein